MSRWARWTLLAALLAGVGCGAVSIKTIIVEQDSPGWVVIETDNPDCGAANGLTLRIRVPPSGYACTSAKVRAGLVSSRYFRAREDGSIEPIPSEFIHLAGTVGLLRGDCDLTAIKFWYGPESAISGHPGDKLGEAHLECGN